MHIISVCIHACIHIHTCMHACIHTYTNIYIYYTHERNAYALLVRWGVVTGTTLDECFFLSGVHQWGLLANRILPPRGSIV